MTVLSGPGVVAPGGPVDRDRSILAIRFGQARAWQQVPAIRVAAATIFLLVGSGLWLGPTWLLGHMVSDLGTGPGGWLMNLTFLGCGIVFGGPGYVMSLLALFPADTQLLGHFTVAWIMFGLMGGAVTRAFGLRNGLLAVGLLVLVVAGPGPIVGLAERAFFALWLAAAVLRPSGVVVRGRGEATV